MNTMFADTLKKLGTEKGLSQIQLAKQRWTSALLPLIVILLLNLVGTIRGKGIKPIFSH